MAGNLLEQQNMGFGSVDLVVLPSKTLGDAQASPLFLVEDLEGSGFGIKVVLGYSFEHVLGEHNVPVTR